MTGVVDTMRSDSAPPSDMVRNGSVFEERKPALGSRVAGRYLFLFGIVSTSVADAAPVRSSFSDPTSATGQIIPYIAHAVRDPRLDSATQILEPVSSVRGPYEGRIAQLQSFAEEDGVWFSSVSERDFLDFACADPQTRAASLVLLDNGNLRAVWRMGEQEVGVQFRGAGSVQYLISKVADDGAVTHTAHTGTIEDFLAALEDADLTRLLYE